MSLSTDKFWDLAEQSRLLDSMEVESLRKEFTLSRVNSSEDTAKDAAEWLLFRRRITGYHARRLLSGHPGPFVFGDYVILQRRRLASPLVERFDAQHLSTRHRVLLTLASSADAFSSQTVNEHFHRGRRIRHHHLDRWHEMQATAEAAFAVSESPPGKSVRQLLDTRKRLPVSKAVHVVHQAAQGLAYLHARGEVHAVLRPEEVIVQDGGHAKVLRTVFPVDPAAELQRDAASISKATAMQSFYAAPELLVERASSDALTDIYALGCVFFEMLTGDPPFADADVGHRLQAHASRRVQPWQEYNLRLPEGLGDVVLFMMAKRRALRFQEMDEVVEKLDRFLPTGIEQTKPIQRSTLPTYLMHLDQQQDPASVPSHLGGESNSSPLGTAAIEQTDPTSRETVEAQRTAPQVSSPGSDPPPRIVITEPKRTVRTPVSRRWGLRRQVLLLTAATVVVALMLVARLLIFGSSGSIKPLSDTDRRVGGDVGTPTRVLAGDAAAEVDPGASDSGHEPSFQVIDDDGQTLWMSPVAGPPPELRFVPAAAQCFLHLRPAQLLGTEAGRASVRALGPSLTARRAWLENLVDFPLEQVDVLLIALTPQNSTVPKPVIVLKMPEAGIQTLRNQLLRGRPGSLQSTPDKVPLGKLDDEWHVWFPQLSEEHCVLAEDVSQLRQIKDHPLPILGRQMERLRQLSSREADLSILVAPHFLAADGQALLSGVFQPVRSEIMQFMGDRTKAFSVTLDVGELAYLELRWITDVEENPYIVAQNRRRQIKRLTDQVVNYLGTISIDPYWQPLALRFPTMLQQLMQHTRIGVHERAAVMNMALPPQAAPNLILASELALSSRLPTQPTPQTGKQPRPSSAPAGWPELLSQRFDFFIDQQSMESAFDELAEIVRQTVPDSQFAIQVVGADLQLKGITRNQQVRDLHLENARLREILTALAVRANPISAASPRTAEQELVWVVDPTAEQSLRQVVLITTRTAAEQKGYELPREFLAE